MNKDTPKASLALLGNEGIDWSGATVRYAADDGADKGWILVNDDTQEAFIVYPSKNDFEDVDYAAAVQRVDAYEKVNGESIIGSRGTSSLTDSPKPPKGTFESQDPDDDVVTELNAAPSDDLVNLVGFANVFANIPRHIRLDVMRMVSGDDTDKIDVNNLKKALNVLGELNPALDDAFMDFFAESEGGDK